MVTSILPALHPQKPREFIDTGLGFTVPAAAENWLALLDDFDVFQATDSSEFRKLLTLVDTAPSQEALAYRKGMLTVVNVTLASLEQRISLCHQLH